MGLPLFTRDIKGKAVERGPEYGSRTSSGEGSEVSGDETEDLYKLIKKIKVGFSATGPRCYRCGTESGVRGTDEQEAHPECTALASGAILSNYQRLRIEHVCQRLGLVSINYLWQAAQLPLLERMLECGMEVILVKVAGVGLGIDLVGKNLREIMPLLRRLVSLFLYGRS
jgi:diphthine-ammonia ligase